MTELEIKLQKRIDTLEKLANYDSLTNLPNKLLFENLLKKSVANAKRNQYIVAIALFDLDDFTDINNNYGHLIGDELIKLISQRLVKKLREGDIIARIGSDEFSIILEHIKDENVIAQVVNAILRNIEEPILLSNGIELSIKASAGIVIAPKDSTKPEELFEYAENSLTQAKKDGRGLYRFYTDDMTQKALQKIAYKDAISTAIDEDKLEVYYQPQIHIQTGKIIGAEALLRWKCSKYGNVPPSIFISIAEDTGLINKLGELVITKACKQGKKWLDNGHNLNISVNISATQVKYQDIYELIKQALLVSDFKHEKLELEITENALMHRQDNFEMLHRLRTQGVKITIDNFGVGYSSLAYLKQLPIDILKIDQSFIDEIPYRTEDSALIKAIIKMGQSLGFQVLAQGVEQSDQLEFLKENGCDFYQGFLKSKPLSVAQFNKLLEKE